MTWSRLGDTPDPVSDDDPWQHTYSTPFVLSKEDLFGHDLLKIEPYSPDDLITSALSPVNVELVPSEAEDSDEDYVIETVRTFKFKIKKEDIARARQTHSSLHVMQETGDDNDEGLNSALEIDNAFVDLLSRAESERGEGDQVIYLDMELKDIESMVRSVDGASDRVYHDRYMSSTEDEADSSEFDYNDEEMETAEDNMRTCDSYDETQMDDSVDDYYGGLCSS
jgi:hypothetical protein